MFGKLGLVAILALVIGAVCIAAVFHFGGQALHERGFNFSFADDCGPLRGGSATRAFSWNGGETVNIDLPGNVHYRAGSGTQVQVTGDPALLGHVRVAGGHVRLDCNPHFFWGHRQMDVTLPGRPFRAFTLAGSGTVTLENIDQPDLRLTLMGAGDLKGSGKAGNLSTQIMGAGDVRLGALTVQHANVTIMGSGNTEIAPVEDAHITIMGSGDVTLRSEPKSLHTMIMGSGSIVHAAPVSQQAPPTGPDNSR
jgi:hypothetical protein